MIETIHRTLPLALSDLDVSASMEHFGRRIVGTVGYWSGVAAEAWYDATVPYQRNRADRRTAAVKRININ